MRIFTSEMIKNGLGISTMPPIYYISEKVSMEALEEVESGEGYAFPKVDVLINSRPFDEVILLITHTDENGNDAVTTILHVEENGDYRNFQYTPHNGFVNQTIRENFVKGLEDGKLDMFDNFELDAQQMRLNQAAMGLLLLPFTRKNTELHFCTGAARTNCKKRNKTKKKNFMLVTRSGKQYISSGAHKSYDKVVAHSVCGHTMTFHKNPHYMGSDREGNPTKGSTWRRPHETGKGEEIMERIRLWIK